MGKIGLTDRQLRILSSIVASYIKNGEPISSGTVYAVLKLNVCTSTIRSDMSYLVAKGFLKKIHSSSGSIPSDSGYKVYVDSIVNKANFCRTKIKHDFAEEKEKEDQSNTKGLGFIEKNLGVFLNSLSRATGCVTFFHLKGADDLVIKKIKIVGITGTCVSLFVVFSNNFVKNKTFSVSFCLDENELSSIENTLNDALCGLKLEEITVSLIQRVVSKNGSLMIQLTEIVSEIQKIIKGMLRESYCFSDIPDEMFKFFSSVGELFSILNFIKSRKLVEDLLKKNSLSNERITVSIGRENSYLGLSDFSIISSKYVKSSNLSGGITVIGPVRMNYSLAISNLIYFSSFLDRFLSRSLDIN